MTISGVNATDPISQLQSATSGSNATSVLGKDQFMKLLVDQMKNQDPMQPADNTQMISQLAQFSSLEQMQTMNSNIVGLAALQQQNALLNQLTTSSGLIGKSVNYTDPTTNTDTWGTVQSVKIVNGIASLSINGGDVPLVNVKEVGTPPPTGSDNSGNGSNS